MQGAGSPPTLMVGAAPPPSFDLTAPRLSANAAARSWRDPATSLPKERLSRCTCASASRITTVRGVLRRASMHEYPQRQPSAPSQRAALGRPGRTETTIVSGAGGRRILALTCACPLVPGYLGGPFVCVRRAASSDPKLTARRG